LKLTNQDTGTAVDLSQLSLDTISETDEVIEIGAMATLHSLGTNLIIQNFCGGILSHAAMKIMGIPVRNIATIGGSVMGKFGFSDLITPLLAMEAKLVFADHEEMTLAAFLDSKENLRDLLVKIIIPKISGEGYFHKVAKTSMDFAMVNVAIVLSENRFRIVIGGRPGIAAFAKKAAQFLSSQSRLTSEILKTAASLAVEELNFSSNQRASGEYRKHLAQVYVERGLKAVVFHEN
jgi:CO/xanthine dehydrogenase FAD-binding subunit